MGEGEGGKKVWCWSGGRNQDRVSAICGAEGGIEEDGISEGEKKTKVKERVPQKTQQPPQNDRASVPDGEFASGESRG